MSVSEQDRLKKTGILVILVDALSIEFQSCDGRTSLFQIDHPQLLCGCNPAQGCRIISLGFLDRYLPSHGTKLHQRCTQEFRQVRFRDSFFFLVSALWIGKSRITLSQLCGQWKRSMTWQTYSICCLITSPSHF